MGQLEISVTTLKLDLTGPQIKQVLAILTADRDRAYAEDTTESPWPQAVAGLLDAFDGYRRTGKEGAVLKLSLTGYQLAVLAGLLSITIDRHQRDSPEATDSAVRAVYDQVIGYRDAVAAVWDLHRTPPE